MRTSIPITRFDFHSLTFAEASTNRHFLGSKGILRYSLSSSNISDLRFSSSRRFVKTVLFQSFCQYRPCLIAEKRCNCRGNRSDACRDRQSALNVIWRKKGIRRRIPEGPLLKERAKSSSSQPLRAEKGLPQPCNQFLLNQVWRRSEEIKGFIQWGRNSFHKFRHIRTDFVR